VLCLQCSDTVGWASGRVFGLEKTEWWGAGMVICLEQGADLHMAQLTPLPLSVSCFSKIQIGFTFLEPAHPGSPKQRAVKSVCVWQTQQKQKPFLIWLLTTPPHLKYVATLPCNLLLIACFLTLMFHKVVWRHMQGVVRFLKTVLLQIY